MFPQNKLNHTLYYALDNIHQHNRYIIIPWSTKLNQTPSVVYLFINLQVIYPFIYIYTYIYTYINRLDFTRNDLFNEQFELFLRAAERERE